MYQKIPWDLIVSVLQGEQLSHESNEAFRSWLSTATNAELFGHLDDIWHGIQQKVNTYEPDMTYYWKELSARMEQTELIEEKQVERIPIATLKQFYRVAAVAAILLLVAIGGFYFGTRNGAEDTPMQTYTSVNGKSKITLPDGSEVWLHANTTLAYRFDRNTKRREATLRGEAFFDIKRDETRPFVVHADEGVFVRVIGTRFNVNSYENKPDVVVSLIEGAVAMGAGTEELRLRQGETGSYDRANKVLALDDGDEDFAACWMQEQLRFENKDLRYVCRYLEKWYAADIEIDPRITYNQSYTFTLSNESLEEIIRIMTKIHSFKYRFEGSNKVVVSR